MWLAETVGRDALHVPPARACPDLTAVAADWIRLWHTRSGPPGGLRKVDVPGCRLLVLGYCPADDRELTTIGEQVARGGDSALASVGGSSVVIAVRRDDAVIVGDLAGQRTVFYTRTPNGRTVLGSHCSHLARTVSTGVDKGWLATRLILPRASDVWAEGSPWTGVQALRPGWGLRLRRTGASSVHQVHTLPTPETEQGDAAVVLRTALRQAVELRVRTAQVSSVDLSGGLDSSTVATLAAKTAPGRVPA